MSCWQLTNAQVDPTRANANSPQSRPCGRAFRWHETAMRTYRHLPAIISTALDILPRTAGAQCYRGGETDPVQFGVLDRLAAVPGARRYSKRGQR